MISFESDYIAGAHPKVLAKLMETNMESLGGYGTDKYCESACEKIRKTFGCEKADVYFLMGGTQTNAIVISSMLNTYEGVVAAKTGHVSLHEAGAIEYTGHKVLEIEQKDGKIYPEILKTYLKTFYADENHEHMVFPGMVYISHPTEYGTLYQKKELKALSAICHEYEIPLYLDGARLGYGLASRDTDVTEKDIAQLCDVFYIGGTKVGALCGEAVIFPKGNAPKHFMTLIKQKGGLLAKGRVLGVQFDTLFTEDLYFEISRHAIDMAEQLKEMLVAKGYDFYIDSPTNQQFVIIDNDKLEKLKESVAVSFWESYDETRTVIRLATSWSTTQEDMNQLKEVL